MPKQWNEVPFEHTGRHGTRLRCERSDFGSSVTIVKPKGTLDSEYASDLAQIFAYHAQQIWPNLRGFNGYDYLDIRTITE